MVLVSVRIAIPASISFSSVLIDDWHTIFQQLRLSLVILDPLLRPRKAPFPSVSVSFITPSLLTIKSRFELRSEDSGAKKSLGQFKFTKLFHDCLLFVYPDRKTYAQQQYHHVGMAKKPLMAYNPNAVRSQLPKPTVVMPYKNSSQIVIGDRSTLDRRQFKTTNTLNQAVHDLDEQTTNGGIISRRFQWTHKHQVMP